MVVILGIIIPQNISETALLIKIQLSVENYCKDLPKAPIYPKVNQEVTNMVDQKKLFTEKSKKKVPEWVTRSRVTRINTSHKGRIYRLSRKIYLLLDAIKDGNLMYKKNDSWHVANQEENNN